MEGYTSEARVGIVAIFNGQGKAGDGTRTRSESKACVWLGNAAT